MIPISDSEDSEIFGLSIWSTLGWGSSLAIYSIAMVHAWALDIPWFYLWQVCSRSHRNWRVASIEGANPLIYSRITYPAAHHIDACSTCTIGSFKALIMYILTGGGSVGQQRS